MFNNFDMNFFTSPEGVRIIMILGFAFLGLVTLVVLGLFILRHYFRKNYKVPYNLQPVVISVGLPKELRADDSNRDLTKEQIWEKISQAEELFASIGGLRSQKGNLNTFFYGKSDHVSFEVVVLKGRIRFYVATPRYLIRYVEQQIHAQYPYAQIEEEKDYNIFSPTSKVAGAYLGLAKHIMFPIKTYKKFDSDAFDGVTNTLSKLAPEDGAVIQCVVRSAQKGWRRRGIKVVKEIQKGKNLGKAIKDAGGGNIVGNLFTGLSSFMGEGMGKSEEQRQREKATGESYKMSALEEESTRGIEEKASKAGLDVNIRIVVASDDVRRANDYMANIINSFSQYSIYEYGNKLNRIAPGSMDKFINAFIHRTFNKKRKMVLNSEEMASIYHFPLSSCETPNIDWLRSRKAPAPHDMPTEGVILGKNIYRGKETIVRMHPKDRRRHLYIIGMTGVGKSVLMENMIKQDMEAGHGVCVIDPHGSLAETALKYVPESRAEDVIYFNPADIERPIGLNMLEASTPEEMDFVTQEMVQIFYKLVTDPSMIGPMFEHNMRNAMMTLMSDKEHPGTIAEIPRIFTDDEFQRYKLQFVTDPMVRAFWENEMAKTSDYHKSEMLGYLISKVGRFIENEMVRNIVGQGKSGFDFREVMDKKKILIINLSKGQVGEVNSNLLGLIAVSKLQMAALGRANIPEEERNDFFLYIDEFQNYVTDSIATILAEARKYKLNMIMAHQYVGQLVDGQDSSIRDAVFGNAGTMVSFRVGVEDAEVIAKQFAPVFSDYDVMNIEQYTAYIRLLINNTASKAFNMATFPPQEGNSPEVVEKMRQLSRLKYGRDRALVNAEILEQTKLAETKKEAETDFSEVSL